MTPVSAVVDAGARFPDGDPRAVVAAVALILAEAADVEDEASGSAGLLKRAMGMLLRNADAPPNPLVRLKAIVLVKDCEYVLDESYKTFTMPRLLKELGLCLTMAGSIGS